MNEQLNIADVRLSMVGGVEIQFSRTMF